MGRTNDSKLSGYVRNARQKKDMQKKQELSASHLVSKPRAGYHTKARSVCANERFERIPTYPLFI
jgi:hypothetical protein